MAYTIDLTKYALPGTKMFNNRSWGILVRNESNIDSLIGKYDEIDILIPSNADNLNTSFLEELLENVVSKLGEDEFRKKFRFTSRAGYNIEPYVSEAISRILKLEVA